MVIKPLPNPYRFLGGLSSKVTVIYDKDSQHLQCICKEWNIIKMVLFEQLERVSVLVHRVSIKTFYNISIGKL